jgi:peroxiredoxin
MTLRLVAPRRRFAAALRLAPHRRFAAALRLALVFGAFVMVVACKQGDAAPAPAAEKPAPAKPAPAAAPTPAATEVLAAAVLGKPAPEFTLNDSDGHPVTLSQLRGKTVVLEWFNPDCPFAKFAHTGGPLKDMAARVARADLVWLSINSSAPGKQGNGIERNKQARTEYAMQNAILLDESGKVGQSYGAKKTPHLFVVDAHGVLVYRGGVDNAPMGEVDSTRPLPEGTEPGKYVNYVDTALEDLVKGRPVRLSDTPAYGCSVKYAS